LRQGGQSSGRREREERRARSDAPYRVRTCQSRSSRENAWFLHCQGRPPVLKFFQFMAEYKVQFEVFEGPLDLLLYLIKKEEVDIYEVNLTRLATSFIEYIDLMRKFDLEIAGEFLVMASTLMYIKSRELLPVDQQVAVEGEEEGEDPRWELIRQLVEYKKFKDAATQLQTLEARQENVFPRLPAKLEFENTAPPPKPDVSIFDLLNAVNAVLKRFEKRDDARDIFEDKWTVSEKIEFILKVIAERGSVRFAELFESAASRSEVVCTFLALLELIRLKQLVCVQPEPFAEIEIRRAENSALAVGAPVSDPARSETASQAVVSQTAGTGAVAEPPRQS
jgi:segregation and condensation protein A